MDSKHGSPELARPATTAAFGRVLRRRREGLKLTLDQVAERTGISKPYLSNIETGRMAGVAAAEKLERIARALDLPMAELVAGGDWLRTPASVRKLMGSATPPRRSDGAIDLDALLGEGRCGATPLNARPASADELALRGVPVINRVAAGKAAEFTDMQYPAGVAENYVPAPDLPEAPLAGAFAVRVSGDSMEPEYVEGEILIVAPREPADGEDCVVRLGEAENFATTFKRVFFERGADGEAEGVRLEALNPKYAPRRLRLEEVSGIYPLVYRLVPAKRGNSERTARGEITTTRVDIARD